MPDASATTDHHRRMSCGVVSRLRAIRSSTRKDRSSRPRRGELPGIERNRPARRGPLPIGAREEIQAIRQLDRAMLAHEDHPRRSGSCSVIVKPYSRIGDEHMFAWPSRAPAGRGTVWGLARKRADSPVLDRAPRVRCAGQPRDGRSKGMLERGPTDCRVPRQAFTGAAGSVARLSSHRLACRGGHALPRGQDPSSSVSSGNRGAERGTRCAARRYISRRTRGTVVCHDCRDVLLQAAALMSSTPDRSCRGSRPTDRAGQH